MVCSCFLVSWYQAVDKMDRKNVPPHGGIRSKAKQKFSFVGIMLSFAGLCYLSHSQDWLLAWQNSTPLCCNECVSTSKTVFMGDKSCLHLTWSTFHFQVLLYSIFGNNLSIQKVTYRVNLIKQPDYGLTMWRFIKTIKMHQNQFIIRKEIRLDVSRVS